MTVAETETMPITKATADEAPQEVPEEFHEFLDAIDEYRGRIKDEVKTKIPRVFRQNAETISALMLREIRHNKGIAVREMNKLVIPAIKEMTAKYFNRAIKAGSKFGDYILNEIDEVQEKQVKKAGLWFEGENYAADAIVRARKDGKDYILMIQRQDGSFAMPGGFVDNNKKGRRAAAAASKRELQEETGLKLPKKVKQKHIGYYGSKIRDPRSDEKAWVSTNAFSYDFGNVKDLPEVTHKGDPDKGARMAKWVDLNTLRQKELFADHKEILGDFLAGKGLRRNEKAIRLQNQDVLVASLNNATNRYVLDSTDLLSTLIYNKVGQEEAKKQLANEIKQGSGQTGRYFNAVSASAQSYIFRVADQAIQEAFRADISLGKNYRWVTFFTRSCPDCRDLHGRIKTLEQWEYSGMPRSGHTVCRMHCHCVIVPEEYPTKIERPVERERGLMETFERSPLGRYQETEKQKQRITAAQQRYESEKSKYGPDSQDAWKAYKSYIKAIPAMRYTKLDMPYETWKEFGRDDREQLLFELHNHDRRMIKIMRGTTSFWITRDTEFSGLYDSMFDTLSLYREGFKRYSFSHEIGHALTNRIQQLQEEKTDKQRIAKIDKIVRQLAEENFILSEKSKIYMESGIPYRTMKIIEGKPKNKRFVSDYAKVDMGEYISEMCRAYHWQPRIYRKWTTPKERELFEEFLDLTLGKERGETELMKLGRKKEWKNVQEIIAEAKKMGQTITPRQAGVIAERAGYEMYIMTDGKITIERPGKKPKEPEKPKVVAPPKPKKPKPEKPKEKTQGEILEEQREQQRKKVEGKVKISGKDANKKLKQLGITKEDMAGAFAHKNIKKYVIIYDTEDQYFIVKARGKGIAIERGLDIKKKEVHHNEIVLEHNLQGRGQGKKLLLQSLDLYERLGIKRITMYAAKEVGGYIWARAGFKPGREDFRHLKSLLKEDFRKSGENPFQVFVKKATNIKDIATFEINLEEYKKIYLKALPHITLEKLRDKKCLTKDGRVKIGKYALLGKAWPGEMEIGSEDYKAFKEYLEADTNTKKR